MAERIRFYMDVIELADVDTLDLQSSRAVVQEVLNTLDERQPDGI